MRFQHAGQLDHEQRAPTPLRPKLKKLHILTTSDIDAVLFDLDGVVTDTATLHIAAWKELFDDYLKVWSAHTHTPFGPFDVEVDYQKYVDGKPRTNGIASFLASRGIVLPYGEPSDLPDQESVCGLGNKKNAIFHQLLQTQGVKVFGTSVTLIHDLKAHAIQTAVVSSSKNCKAVLVAAGLSDLFNVCIDEVERERLNLPGKPAPDTFLEAARRLGVEPARTVVVEDAIAGVQAGRHGKFGLVIGVARKGDRAVLLEHGADIVVEDLRDIHLTADEEANPLPWRLPYDVT